MKDHEKYDPEDIESLLKSKRFDELYPEEKEFILRHIENGDEYESLRSTLIHIQDAMNSGDWLEPDASIKKEVMKQFVSEKKGGFRIWLNSLFIMPELPWYRQRGWQLAMAVVAIGGGVLFFSQQESSKALLADNSNFVADQNISAAEQLPISSTSEPLPKPETSEILPMSPPIPMITIDDVNEEEVVSITDNFSENDNVGMADSAPVMEEAHKTPQAAGAERKATEAESYSNDAVLCSPSSNSLTKAEVQEVFNFKEVPAYTIATVSTSLSLKNFNKLLPVLYTAD